MKQLLILANCSVHQVVRYKYMMTTDMMRTNYVEPTDLEIAAPIGPIG